MFLPRLCHCELRCATLQRHNSVRLDTVTPCNRNQIKSAALIAETGARQNFQCATKPQFLQTNSLYFLPRLCIKLKILKQNLKEPRTKSFEKMKINQNISKQRINWNFCKLQILCKLFSNNNKKKINLLM